MGLKEDTMNDINERIRNGQSQLVEVRGDTDTWEYYLHERIGIVINLFIDDGYLRTNLYFVPEEHVARNNWHSDMVDISHEREDA